MLVQEWTLDQLVKVRQYQPTLVDQAIETLLLQQEELRWFVVVGAYLDERINLGKAAELLGIHRLELQQRFIKQGIPLRLGPANIEEAKAEVDAIMSWEQENTHDRPVG
ncbi:UPF0175 family protein [Anaerolineales bacterium HSG24]|nr:UPF0175 family protein [Anaerolineales bacterium HSG24]